MCVPPISAMVSKIYIFTACLLLLAAHNCVSTTLHSNETELLSVFSLQTAPSPELVNFRKDLTQRIDAATTQKFRAVPGIFAQQNLTVPTGDDLQLPAFGANMAWPDILDMLQDPSKKRIMLIMIRHGQAWENLTPGGDNTLCEFTLNGDLIDNYDSRLTPAGIDQAKSLNEMLHSSAPESQSSGGGSWSDAIGLSRARLFVTSPLSRTLQTANYALSDLSVPEIVAHEMLRGNSGSHVSNVRRSVLTPTSESTLPPPWATGCKHIPTDSLTGSYSKNAKNSEINLNFKFPIRPAGAGGFGLVSDEDSLWRSDYTDNTQQDRMKTFLAQLFDHHLDDEASTSTSTLPVYVAVTHSEMITAVYEAVGAGNYHAKNTEVVPLMLELL